MQPARENPHENIFKRALKINKKFVIYRSMYSHECNFLANLGKSKVSACLFKIRQIWRSWCLLFLLFLLFSLKFISAGHLHFVRLFHDSRNGITTTNCLIGALKFSSGRINLYRLLYLDRNVVFIFFIQLILGSRSGRFVQ